MQISIGSKLQLKVTILIFLGRIYPKRVFPVKNWKSEHYYWILDIWISLGSKFQLKITFLIFWTKFDQKGCFQSKMKKLDTTIELIYNPGHNILELYNILVQIWFTLSKTKLDI